MRYFFVNLSKYNLKIGVGHTILLNWLYDAKHHAFFFDASSYGTPRERLHIFKTDFQRLSWDQQGSDTTIFFFISPIKINSDNEHPERWMAEIIADFYNFQEQFDIELSLKLIFLEKKIYSKRTSPPADIVRYPHDFQKEWKPTKLWKELTNDAMEQETWVHNDRVKKIVHAYRLLNWVDENPKDLARKESFYYLKVFLFIYSLIRCEKLKEKFFNSELSLFWRVRLSDLDEDALRTGIHKLSHSIEKARIKISKDQKNLKCARKEVSGDIPKFVKSETDTTEKLDSIQLDPKIFVSVNHAREEWDTMKNKKLLIYKEFIATRKKDYRENLAKLSEMAPYLASNSDINSKDLNEKIEEIETKIEQESSRLNTNQKHVQKDEIIPPHRHSLLDSSIVGILYPKLLKGTEVESLFLLGLRTQSNSFRILWKSVVALVILGCLATFVSLYSNYSSVLLGGLLILVLFALAVNFYINWLKSEIKKCNEKIKGVDAKMIDYIKQAYDQSMKQLKILNTLKVLNINLSFLKKVRSKLEERDMRMTHHQNCVESLKRNLSYTYEEWSIEKPENSSHGFTSEEIDGLDLRYESPYLPVLGIQNYLSAVNGKEEMFSFTDNKVKVTSTEDGGEGLVLFSDLVVKVENKFQKS